ncbi:MAG: carboxyl transferase domain-containing protein [Bacteroidia bacterium]|jgi:3-methylcrotonyl-CoA carboxylase beta subunit|nr:carboxyl transferase domain-containing protein [Bacteroidia bacterium]
MNPKDLEFNKNEDANKMLWSDYQKLAKKIHLGGGEKSLAKQRVKGKLTARERIGYLKDNQADFLEIGTFAGYEMYPEYGGCPAGGVIGGITSIAGRKCLVVANDASVKAGAWFPISGKKNLRFQEIALENNLPIIYLVDSAGVFLPLQDEIFPDKEHFGRIFRNNAILSSRGIPQIAAVMGSCVAGGAYLPIMSDEALIVDKTGSIFLAGSYLVKAAIGEDIDNETLGGSVSQTDLSGVIDDRFPNDKSCLDRIKFLMDKIGSTETAGFNRAASIEPKYRLDEVLGVLPRERNKPYKSLELIHRLVDDSAFEQYKGNFGKTIICGYGRIDGWAVGIVANNRELVKSKKGEMQFGGVIYSDSADKAARFIMNCNQKKIPLVFLQDVTGFMVGSRSEQGGIIKDGAKMVNAMSNSTVPKFTVIVGNSYGAGNYAMCGKAYDPRLIVAWPTAKIAVMGGEQAAKVLLQIEKASLAKKGEVITPDKEKELLDKIIDKYNRQTTPEYAASRLWVDEIINPADTRLWLSTGIEIANNTPVKKYNVGVIQT